MKDIKLNKNSWHNHLYSELYNTNILPDNFCPYFWKVMFALITLPLWCIIIKFDSEFNDDTPCWFKIYASANLYVLVFICTSPLPILLLDELHIGVQYSWIYYLSPLIGILILFMLICLCILPFLPLYFIYKIRYDEEDNIFKIKIKSYLGKYYPKINWK